MSGETLVDSTTMDNPARSSSVGNLSLLENRAFAELKRLCEKNDLSWPVSELEGDPATGVNNDLTLLRYLRARNNDPQAAFKQYSATAAWRRKYNIDQFYDDANIEQFEAMRRLQPQWTGRRDRKGVPLMVYIVADVQSADLIKVGQKDPDLSSIFLAAEYVTNFVQPLCGQMSVNGNQACSTNIIDLSGVGVRIFWNLRKMLQVASNMATAHYPESVERIFVVGAPTFFPTIWGFITRWFEPATTRKISVLGSSQAKATLAKYIDPENLPVRLGGKLEWDFGQFPVLDEEAKKLVPGLADQWVDGPLRCIVKEKEITIMAVGSERGEKRRKAL